MFNVELFAATHAIESSSILNCLYSLSKMFQIFTAVHNSFLGSAAKILLSNLSADLRVYTSPSLPLRKAPPLFSVFC